MLVAIVGLAAAGACSGGASGPPATSSPTTEILGAPGSSAPATAGLPPDPDGLPTLTVVATEKDGRFQFDAADVVPAGPLGLELDNQGTQPHDVAVLRANPNVSRQQLAELLSGPAPEAVTAIAQFLGGSAAIAPNTKQTVALTLDPGDYFLASLYRGPDGRIGAAGGLYRSLTVVPDAPNAKGPASPESAGTVSITDDMVTLPPGFGLAGWYKVQDDGTQPHELTIVKLNDGVTADQLKAWLVATESGPSLQQAPFVLVGGSGALSPGNSDLIRVELGPGNYVAYCTMPNLAANSSPSYNQGAFLAFSRAE